MRFIVKVLISGAAIWAASKIVPGMVLHTDGTTGGTLLLLAVTAVIFTLVNAIIKPVVKVIALPLYILTLGLFFIVVNATMLMLASWISQQTPYGMSVDGFGSAMLAALLISLVSMLLSFLLPSRKPR